MTSRRASFYSRDPDRLIRDKNNPKKKKYLGIERRMENRRKAKERRVDVRFEMKNDRRQKPGRREEDAPAKYW
jgi:hypothetical protein